MQHDIHVHRKFVGEVKPDYFTFMIYKEKIFKNSVRGRKKRLKRKIRPFLRNQSLLD